MLRSPHLPLFFNVLATMLVTSASISYISCAFIGPVLLAALNPIFDKMWELVEVRWLL